MASSKGLVARWMEQLDTAEEGRRKGGGGGGLPPLGLWAQLLAWTLDPERVSLARPGRLSHPLSLRDGVKKKTDCQLVSRSRNIKGAHV